MITPTEPRGLEERRAAAAQVAERIASGRHLPHATAVLRALRLRALRALAERAKGGAA